MSYTTPAKFYLTKQQQEYVYKLCGGCCAYCGRPLKRSEATVDHVQPKARNGSDEPDNLLLACKPCNAAKANRNLAEFMPEVADLIPKPERSAPINKKPKANRFQHKPFAALSQLLQKSKTA